MKIISIIVNFFGAGFSTEKYSAFADKNVVVKIAILSPDLISAPHLVLQPF